MYGTASVKPRSLASSYRARPSPPSFDPPRSSTTATTAAVSHTTPAMLSGAVTEAGYRLPRRMCLQPARLVSGGRDPFGWAAGLASDLSRFSPRPLYQVRAQTGDHRDQLGVVAKRVVQLLQNPVDVAGERNGATSRFTKLTAAILEHHGVHVAGFPPRGHPCARGKHLRRRVLHEHASQLGGGPVGWGDETQRRAAGWVNGHRVPRTHIFRSRRKIERLGVCAGHTATVPGSLTPWSTPPKEAGRNTLVTSRSVPSCRGSSRGSRVRGLPGRWGRRCGRAGVGCAASCAGYRTVPGPPVRGQVVVRWASPRSASGPGTICAVSPSTVVSRSSMVSTTWTPGRCA